MVRRGIVIPEYEEVISETTDESEEETEEQIEESVPKSRTESAPVQQTENKKKNPFGRTESNSCSS
jgi:hypothetical protein